VSIPLISLTIHCHHTLGKTQRLPQHSFQVCRWTIADSCFPTKATTCQEELPATSATSMLTPRTNETSLPSSTPPGSAHFQFRCFIFCTADTSCKSLKPWKPTSGPSNTSRLALCTSILCKERHSHHHTNRRQTFWSSEWHATSGDDCWLPSSKAVFSCCIVCRPWGLPVCTRPLPCLETRPSSELRCDMLSCSGLVARPALPDGPQGSDAARDTPEQC
jgi:hypothetical protein